VDTVITIPIHHATVGVVRAVVPFLDIPARRSESGRLASADLSPPFGRSSDILRL